MEQNAQLCRVVSSTYKKKQLTQLKEREKWKVWKLLIFPPSISMFEISGFGGRNWTFRALWISDSISKSHIGIFYFPLLMGTVLRDVFVLFTLFPAYIPFCNWRCFVFFSFFLSVMECSITAGKSVSSGQLGRSERTTKVRCCLRNSVEHLMRSITTRKLDFPALRPATWSHLLHSGFWKVGGSSSWEFSTTATFINSALINIPAWTRL